MFFLLLKNWGRLDLFECYSSAYSRSSISRERDGGREVDENEKKAVTCKYLCKWNQESHGL